MVVRLYFVFFQYFICIELNKIKKSTVYLTFVSLELEGYVGDVFDYYYRYQKSATAKKYTYTYLQIRVMSLYIDVYISTCD